jgi:tetratricopeptide (TPR) repeat protein
VALDEQNASVWASLGAIQSTLEYLDEAGEAYEQAVTLEPDFFAWHILLARHELKRGTLKSVLDGLGISVQEFIDAL